MVTTTWRRAALPAPLIPLIFCALWATPGCDNKASTRPDAGPLGAMVTPSSDAGESEDAAPCVPVAGDCAGVEIDGTANFIQAIDGCNFALTAPTQSNDALIDALVSRAGGAVRVADVLTDLDRHGQSGISMTHAGRLQGLDWQGFRWDSDDVSSSAWYPQGVSSASDADDSDFVDGQRVLMVSWYNKTQTRPTQGARISLINIDDLGAVRYRHLLLVEPFDDAGSPNFGPAQYDDSDHDALHAGGIVWYGDRLYVADTFVGLRVFDLSRIIPISHSDAPESIGISADRIDAHGYRYAVPQLSRYALASDSCTVRFSFAGLDRSSSPHRIITGEWHERDVNGRLVAWPVDAESGMLPVQQGEVRELVRLIRDLDHEKQAAVNRARIMPWRMQ